MGNMSYCRFQNTAGDLRDCAEAIEEIFSGEHADGPLGEREMDAAERLVTTALDIINMIADESGDDLGSLDDHGIEARFVAVLRRANDKLRAAREACETCETCDGRGCGECDPNWKARS